MTRTFIIESGQKPTEKQLKEIEEAQKSLGGINFISDKNIIKKNTEYLRYRDMEKRIKGIISEINEELAELFGEKIERIILYGSYARGDFNLESDVDIMVLLKCNQEEIKEKRKETSRIASRTGLRNDIMVSILARNNKEYESSIKYQPFYQNREGRNGNLWIKQERI